jgi:glycosyltransferase involved in cell wall biosynthesis
MKILAITNVFGRPWDTLKGPFNQIIFDGLAARNELTLLVPVSFIEVIQNFRSFFSRRKTGTARWPYADYFIYWHIPGVFQGINSIFMFLSLLVARPKTVLFGQWDLVFASWLFPDCVVANWIGRMRGIPSFAHAIGSDVNVFAKRKVMRLQILFFLKGCSKIMTVSGDLERKLQGLGIPKERTQVVYNGVDGDVFKLQNRNEARSEISLSAGNKMILFVGRLSREKGCIELLDAFAQLVAIKEDVVLVFVGYGSLLDELVAKASALGLSKKVMFAGPIAHADLGKWFAAANLFCLPSYMEGVPNVVMEAMSCGVPIVATNVGGIPEVVHSDAGILVNPQEVNSLTAALALCLDTEWSPDAIRGHAGKYTWSATITEIEESMRSAIEVNRDH